MSLVDELLFAFYFAILLVNMIDVSPSPWQNNVTPVSRQKIGIFLPRIISC